MTRLSPPSSFGDFDWIWQVRQALRIRSITTDLPEQHVERVREKSCKAMLDFNRQDGPVQDNDPSRGAFDEDIIHERVWEISCVMRWHDRTRSL